MLSGIALLAESSGSVQAFHFVKPAAEANVKQINFSWSGGV
jgi:hypothetical protein